MKLMEALMQHKIYVVVALAALAIFAYAVPYGIDVEAKHAPGHPGQSTGSGYGLNCDHFKAPGPVRCR